MGECNPSSFGGLGVLAMPRFTPAAWWCRNGTRNSPDARVCPCCSQNKVERCAAVHQSERAVVYYNPLTGEHKTPPRADTPMPDRYVEAGFERREIDSMLAWEREAGVVHEATNFAPGNEPMSQEKLPEPNPEARKAVIDDIVAAVNSGPWTGQERILGGL